MRNLRPRWSSLAVDLWSRPSNSSAAEARKRVHAEHADVLSLFGRVLFLETLPRRDLPSHIRPSFSYRLHWHAAFADPVARGELGRHSEGVPELLAGLDADVYVPARLPLDAILRVLQSAAAADDGVVADTEALARRAWVDGIKPPCGPTEAKRGRARQHRLPPAPPPPEQHDGQQHERRRQPAPRQLCEVATASHSPLFVSPHDLASLKTDRHMSYAELGLSLYPLRMGHCCGRQNVAATEELRATSGASAATLSRGPWCPSSAFWILHRRTLQRHLAGLRLWQEAFDRRALTRDLKRLRWEYVGCALLAPGEAVLHLHYNYSSLDD